jgi:hypothetical protein
MAVEWVECHYLLCFLVVVASSTRREEGTGVAGAGESGVGSHGGGDRG